MAARERLDPSSPVPLYHQLAEALRYQIATGALAAGAQLSPLRQAAREWRINLHTVRRAYQELAAAGLVETRTPEGTHVMGKTDPADHASSLRAFVARVRREAREHGLSPFALARLLAGGESPGPAPRTVYVAECSETQCRDLAAQLEARWDVCAVPWCLGGTSDLAEPPPGPIVATYFHYNDVRRAWPARLADVRFVAIRPDAGLLSLAGSGQRRRRVPVVLCERDAPMAQNIAADLALLLPPDRVRLSVRIVARAADALRRRRLGEVLLFSPRLWGELSNDARRMPAVREARYVFDPTDLEALGGELGWSSHLQGVSHALA